MNQSLISIAISRISQCDPFTFMVTWTDGVRQSFRLSDLQRACPCAQCVDEISGERILKPESVPESLQAKRIRSVGRYALRVDFSVGCSHGIFPFDLLRTLGKDQEADL